MVGKGMEREEVDVGKQERQIGRQADRLVSR